MARTEKMTKSQKDQSTLPGFETKSDLQEFMFDSNVFFSHTDLSSLIVRYDYPMENLSLGKTLIMSRLLQALARGSTVHELYKSAVLNHEGKLQEHEEVLETHSAQLKLLGSMLGHVYENRELMGKDSDEIGNSMPRRKADTLREARKCLKDIENCFEDTEARLNSVMRLKVIARNMWLVARDGKNKYLRQIAMMLHDSVAKIYAEDIIHNQLDGISAILDIMDKDTNDINDARRVDDILTTNRMDYLPDIKEESESVPVK